MKKLPCDFDSEECLTAFKRLKRSERQKALSMFICEPIQVYISENLFKDVIHIIGKYIDLQTWGRLKQVCKLFDRQLKMYLGSKALLFLPQIRRLCACLKNVRPSFDIKFHYDREAISLKNKLNRTRSRYGYEDFIWFRFGKIKIAYASGFVFSGGANLFDSDFINLIVFEDETVRLKRYSELTISERIKYIDFKRKFKGNKK